MHFTDGIILKKDQYREADFLITVLTKDFGKIRLAARGVRKQEAKLRGHIFRVCSHKKRVPANLCRYEGMLSEHSFAPRAHARDILCFPAD